MVGFSTLFFCEEWGMIFLVCGGLIYSLQKNKTGSVLRLMAYESTNSDKTVIIQRQL